MTENKNLEEISQLSEISFPNLIPAGQAIDVMRHLNSNLEGVRIDYWVTSLGRMKHPGQHEEHVEKIDGRILRISQGNLVHTTFYFERGFSSEDSEDLGSFRSLRLSSIGNNYDKIPSDEVELWRDINRIVREYITERVTPSTNSPSQYANS